MNKFVNNSIKIFYGILNMTFYDFVVLFHKLRNKWLMTSKRCCLART